MRWCIFFDTKPTSILLILKNCVKVEIRRCIYTYYIAIAIANDEKANFLFFFYLVIYLRVHCSVQIQKQKRTTLMLSEKAVRGYVVLHRSIYIIVCKEFFL